MLLKLEKICAQFPVSQMVNSMQTRSRSTRSRLLGQAVESTAVATTQRKLNTLRIQYFDHKLLLRKECCSGPPPPPTTPHPILVPAPLTTLQDVRQCQHKDPVVSGTTNFSQFHPLKILFACSFHFHHKRKAERQK